MTPEQKRKLEEAQKFTSQAINLAIQNTRAEQVERIRCVRIDNEEEFYEGDYSLEVGAARRSKEAVIEVRSAKGVTEVHYMFGYTPDGRDLTFTSIEYLNGTSDGKRSYETNATRVKNALRYGNEETMRSLFGDIPIDTLLNEG